MKTRFDASRMRYIRSSVAFVPQQLAANCLVSVGNHHVSLAATKKLALVVLLHLNIVAELKNGCMNFNWLIYRSRGTIRSKK